MTKWENYFRYSFFARNNIDWKTGEEVTVSIKEETVVQFYVLRSRGTEVASSTTVRKNRLLFRITFESSSTQCCFRKHYKKFRSVLTYFPSLFHLENRVEFICFPSCGFGILFDFQTWWLDVQPNLYKYNTKLFFWVLLHFLSYTANSWEKYDYYSWARCQLVLWVRSFLFFNEIILLYIVSGMERSLQHNLVYFKTSHHSFYISLIHT